MLMDSFEVCGDRQSVGVGQGMRGLTLKRSHDIKIQLERGDMKTRRMCPLQLRAQRRAQRLMGAVRMNRQKQEQTKEKGKGGENEGNTVSNTTTPENANVHARKPGVLRKT